MKDLYIVGAGGFGREVAWLVERINKTDKIWNIKGFIENKKELIGSDINGYKIVGDNEYLKQQKNAYVVLAIGSSQRKKQIIEELKNCDLKFATLVDPSVIKSDLVNIGKGTIICAGTIITVNANIGNFVTINLDCTVGHDAVINDYVTVYPSVNISGQTNIGECTEIGTGTQIIQGLSISDNCIIGAGAVITKNLTESGTYVGVPVKKIK